MRNFLVGVPFLLFGSFVAFAFFSMQREDPDVLPSINIGKDAPRVQLQPLMGSIPFGQSDLRNGNMPDLRGMGIQDAIYLLESYGLVVEITGSGSVQSQSISKGNKFIKGSLIKLELA